MHRRRQPYSIISTAIVICLIVLQQCDADVASDINDDPDMDDYPQVAGQSSSSSINSNLLDIRPVNYSTWNRNVTYVSSAAFNARGMAPLYNITNMVINLFVDANEPIPKGMKFVF